MKSVSFMSVIQHSRRLHKLISRKPSFNILQYPGEILHSPPSIPTHIKIPSYVQTKNSHKRFLESFLKPVFKSEIKNKKEIERIKEACAIGRAVLNSIRNHVKVGVSTKELDDIARDLIFQHNAYPSPLGYKGFPRSICTSVNNVVVHGIPDNRKLMNGDILNIDVTVFLNGVHGDLSEMFCVGDVDEDAVDLINTTKQCLYAAIKACKHNVKLNEIGNTISEIADSHGYTVCPYFVGHGIGEEFHEQPQILHHRNNHGGLMYEGMVFTIEPVLCEGCGEIKHWNDNWTVVTSDNKRSAQFEHTILITQDGAEILTYDC